MLFLRRNKPTSFSMPALNSTKKEELEVKLVMIGESSVGKSSIVDRLVHDKFSFSVSSTIGAAFCALIKVYNNRKYKFQIWDTAGQERFRSLVPIYVKKTKIVLLVFDITSRGSFNKIKEHWYQFVDDLAPESVKILIGNKSDLEDNRCIGKYEAKEYADAVGIDYIECSAKDTSNISKLLSKLVEVGEEIYTEKSSSDLDIEDYGTVLTLVNGFKKENTGCFGIKCNH